jgi:hypothetical protein
MTDQRHLSTLRLRGGYFGVSAGAEASAGCAFGVAAGCPLAPLAAARFLFSSAVSASTFSPYVLYVLAFSAPGALVLTTFSSLVDEGPHPDPSTVPSANAGSVSARNGLVMNYLQKKQK